ncbi:hypothetical protein PpBr36_02962 [Pyricularia pennisetigena]|nr:hypothetical protein PpBr36_02962 [Pyricularia pennisetigena]TLS30300.1 hypothetical protein PpBr36_02962 [Pyricularia pennisetigena]
MLCANKQFLFTTLPCSFGRLYLAIVPQRARGN